MKRNSISTLALIILSSLFFMSCKKDAFIRDRSGLALANVSLETFSPSALDNNGPAFGNSNNNTSSNFNLNINWNGKPNGPYGYSQSLADFKNVVFWGDPSKSQVYNGMLRTTLLKNTLADGGVISRVDIPDGSEYELTFDMKFDANFDFSWGGKVGFGFLIGEGYTGGEPASNGNGGSARLMWYKNYSSGPVFLKPYIYHKDQPGTWGEDFGKTFPASGSIQKNTWYHVTMKIKSNTGSNTNGKIIMQINGTTLLDRDMRWTTNDSKRLINNLCFETFRGGGESYWQSATNGDIYFNNVNVKMIQP